MARVTADELRRYLGGILLPATPETAVQQAIANGAPPEVVQSLQRMPPGEWHSIDRILEVWEHTAAARK